MNASEFVKKLRHELSFLKEHTERMIRQFRKIKRLKEVVKDPDSRAKLVRIDWSENAELFQTKQEKSLYYNSVSASVNTGILYEKDLVISLGTISDDESHKAFAIMASVTKMLKFTKLTNVDKLYIISDSPTSQYRNKKNDVLHETMG